MHLLRKLVGLIFPLFAKAGDFRRLGAVKWILHFLLLGLILGGLWYANKKFDIQKFVPVSNEYIRAFYLPILFGLIYLLCWFVWWLYKLLGPEAETSDFPDIDDAWAEACAALQSANISLPDTPLFLVVGQPTTGADTLFIAPGMNLPVRPRTMAAPVQVWAGNDAIFVVASGASIGGSYCQRLSGGSFSDAPAAAAEDPTDAALATIGLKSIGIATDQRSEIQAIIAQAQREGRPLTADEQARLRQLAGPKKTSAPGRTVLSSEDANMMAARLRHLCRIIARDRDPFCPANGVLTLIPWAATETNEAADEAALVVERDLTTVREGLQLFCPVIAMFCDLEQARGFREFRAGFPSEQLKRRLGQRLPLAPDLQPSEIPGMFEIGAQWVGKAVFPTWVFKMLKLEPDPDESRTNADIEAANRNLHALLREVRLRYPRLGRILSKGLGGALVIEDWPDAPPLFGGCYIAGTGRQPEEQAFIPGVLQRLVEGQSYVSWTPDVFGDDDWFRRNTRLGYIGVMLFVLSVVGAAVWWFGFKK